MKDFTSIQEACFLGLPPFIPLDRHAAILAGDLDWPPRRPMLASHDLAAAVGNDFFSIVIPMLNQSRFGCNSNKSHA